MHGQCLGKWQFHAMLLLEWAITGEDTMDQTENKGSNDTPPALKPADV